MTRNLNADLAICNAATSGPWRYEDGIGIYTEGNYITFPGISGGQCVLVVRKADAAFITEARTGWPAAIERLMKAEAEITELCAEIETLRDENRRLKDVISRCRCEECGDELSSGWFDESDDILCVTCAEVADDGETEN